MANDPWAEFRLKSEAPAGSGDPWAEFRATAPTNAPAYVEDTKGGEIVPAHKGFVGYVDDAARALAQGVTFGYADELAARSNALLGRGTYEDNLKAERERDKQISPWIGVPMEVAGAVGTTIAAAPMAAPVAAMRAVQAIPQIARYAGVGAGLGALGGSGNAEDSRLAGAGVGAGVGLAAGAATPYVARGLSSAAKGVRNVFAPQSHAAYDLGRAILRDNDTPAALAQRASGLAQDRPGVAILADAGGENVRGLVERVAQTPGAGRTRVVPSLTVRQQGQLYRIADDLGRLTGTSRTAFDAIQQTMADRAAAARPLYDAAFNFNARQVPEIVNAWQRETSQGWGRSVLGSADFRKTLQTEYGISNPTNAPLMVVIDAWKKQVDGLIGEAVRDGNNNRARVLGEMRDRLVATVDQHNPAYATARAAWADPSRYVDAIERGRDILRPSVSADEMTAAFAAMSPAEQEAFRIGAVSAIRGRMGSDPARLGNMTKYLRSPEARAKVAAIMPDQASADAWTRRLNFEVDASELTGRALGNSATARRLAERQDSESLVTDLAADALAGSTMGSLWRHVVMAGPKRIRDTVRSRADARLAEALTDPATIAQPNALNALLTRAQRAAAPISPNSNLGMIAGTNALFNYGVAP